MFCRWLEDNLWPVNICQTWSLDVHVQENNPLCKMHIPILCFTENPACFHVLWKQRKIKTFMLIIIVSDCWTSCHNTESWPSRSSYTWWWCPHSIRSCPPSLPTWLCVMDKQLQMIKVNPTLSHRMMWVESFPALRLLNNQPQHTKLIETLFLKPEEIVHHHVLHLDHIVRDALPLIVTDEHEGGPAVIKHFPPPSHLKEVFPSTAAPLPPLTRQTHPPTFPSLL